MKKNILFIFIGMFIMACISIGVYAINANEITYNNTTVEGAIDDLYTTANKYESLSFKLYADSRSTNRLGRAIIMTSNFKDKYNYFRISNAIDSPINSATSTCSVKGYNNGEIDLTPNTDYPIDSSGSIELSNYSSIDNSTARCYITVTFHN